MDTYIQAGPVTIGVLTNVIHDVLVVLKVPGKALIEALENCVSMYPNLSGRYCSVSGIEFTWDCSKKPNNRVLVETVKVNGAPVDLEKVYRVAVHSFSSKGGDGFVCFKNC